MEIETEDPKYETIGKYRILKTLGKGVSSIIKLGFDSENEKFVALKILSHEWTKYRLKAV